MQRDAQTPAPNDKNISRTVTDIRTKLTSKTIDSPPQKTWQDDLKEQIFEDLQFVSTIKSDQDLESPEIALDTRRKVINIFNYYMMESQNDDEYIDFLRRIECKDHFFTYLALYVEVAGKACYKEGSSFLTHRQQEFLNIVGAQIPIPEIVSNLQRQLRQDAIGRQTANRERATIEITKSINGGRLLAPAKKALPVPFVKTLVLATENFKRGKNTFGTQFTEIAHDLVEEARNCQAEFSAIEKAIRSACGLYKFETHETNLLVRYVRSSLES